MVRKSVNSTRLGVAVRCLVVCAAALIVVGPARSELPPFAYIQMQKEAPEAITIRVTSIRTETQNHAEGKSMSFTVRATVIAVARSQSGLRPGQQIVIEYSRFESKQPIAGPSQPPVLQSGQQYPAYLMSGASKGVYELAARGRSFDRMGK